MKKIFVLILSLCLLCSCYKNEYLGETIEKYNETGVHYVTYTDEELRPFNECHLTMFLERIDNPQNYISKNENVEIIDATIKVKVYDITGTYKRYMHLYIKDKLNIHKGDTIQIW